MRKWESGQVKRSNGVRECRSKVVKENYTDTPIHRYTDTEIPRYPDTPIRYKAGFTLIEMMIVLLIIAITIGGVVFTARGTYRRTSVKNAARDVASLMRMAHSKALSERIYYNVVLDLDNENCYLERMYSHGPDRIWENIPLTAGDESTDNLIETDGSPGASKKMPRAVDIDKVTDSPTTTASSGTVPITFTLKGTVVDCSDPYDTPDYSVFLDDKKTGSVQYLVTVDSDTARVKIYSTWTP